jgi:hypothetical protein
MFVLFGGRKLIMGPHRANLWRLLGPIISLHRPRKSCLCVSFWLFVGLTTARKTKKAERVQSNKAHYTTGGRVSVSKSKHRWGISRSLFGLDLPTLCVKWWATFSSMMKHHWWLRKSRYVGGQSFRGAHRGKVCVRVFIGVSVCACCGRLHCIVWFLKKSRRRFHHRRCLKMCVPPYELLLVKMVEANKTLCA